VFGQAAAMFFESLDKQIKAAREKVQFCEQELEKLRIRLMRARKSVRMLEKLKEKRKLVFNMEVRHLEQKKIDETGVLRYKAGQG
jgi:flagellar export protein FliJ